MISRKWKAAEVVLMVRETKRTRYLHTTQHDAEVDLPMKNVLLLSSALLVIVALGLALDDLSLWAQTAPRPRREIGHQLRNGPITG